MLKSRIWVHLLDIFLLKNLLNTARLSTTEKVLFVHGWKPICGVEHLCKNDLKSIFLGLLRYIFKQNFVKIIDFLGQKEEILDKSRWEDSKTFPAGWSGISNFFLGICLYAGSGRFRAICDTGKQHPEWHFPNTFRSYMCGKIIGKFQNFQSYV